MADVSRDSRVAAFFDSLNSEQQSWSDVPDSPVYSPCSPWNTNGVPQPLSSSKVRPTFLLNVPMHEQHIRHQQQHQHQQTHQHQQQTHQHQQQTHQHQQQTHQQPHQQPQTKQFSKPLKFIDQTNRAYESNQTDCKFDVAELAMRPSTEGSLKRSRNKDDLAVKRSAIARNRPRDAHGHFLPKGVAVKIDMLSSQLQESQNECEALRARLAERERQLKQLQQQLHSQAHQLNYQPNIAMGMHQMAPPVARSLLPMEECTHAYQPNSYRSEAKEEPFREKIDFSKVALRKTNSGFMTPEERQMYDNQQLQWEIVQGVNDIRRKADEQMRLLHHQNRPDPNFSQFVGTLPPELAASQSHIFSQPNKIGNLLVPAFREKVDIAQQANSLKKTEEAQLQQQRLSMDSQMAMAEGQHMDISHEQLRRSGNFSVAPEYWSPAPMDADVFSPGMHVDSQSHPSTPTEAMHMDGSVMRFGGPPSDIYPPPDKIGNRIVPAFTEKVNFADIQLKSTQGPFSQHLDSVLVDHQHELFHTLWRRNLSSDLARSYYGVINCQNG